jgi:hypothetical protein
MKAKLLILVIVTLIIGFVLGMLTSAQLRYHRLKPVKVFFSEDRFREGFYRAIQPDDKQKAKIDHVLDKYAKINGELQSNFRRELDSRMKDFRKELDSTLTKEQIARLKDMDERRQEIIRQNRKNWKNDTLRLRGERYHWPSDKHAPGNPPSDQPMPGNQPPPPPPPGDGTNRLPDNK